MRIARFHSKFIRLENEDFSVAVRTSMNLNMNRRIENYEITEGPLLAGYLKDIVDFHFRETMQDSYAAFKAFRMDRQVKPAISRLVDNPAFHR